MSIIKAQQQKGGAKEEVRQRMMASTDELTAFCPQCKTFETLWFTGDVLLQTRKFSQKAARVYHDCGSNEPCRLFPRFVKKG